MNKRIIYFISAALTAGFSIITSCTKAQTQEQESPPSGAVTVKATLAGYSGQGEALDGENTVTDMQACIFENGRMTRIFKGLSLSGGTCDLEVDSRTGTLYLLANTDGLVDLESVKNRNMTEEEWLKTAVPMKDGSPANFFSGSLDLENGPKTGLPVGLKRGLARFDLIIKTAGETAVSKVTLKNAAGSAYLFPDQGSLSPEGVTRGSLSASFSEPLTSSTPGVLYVYEQENDDIGISVEAMIDGKSVTLEKTLSEGLRRNTIYTVTISKDHIDVSLDVTFEDWEQGGDTELVPTVRSI